MKLRFCCGLIMLILIAACGTAEPETETPDGAPTTPETTATPQEPDEPEDGEPDATRNEGGDGGTTAEPTTTDVAPDPPAAPPTPDPEPAPAPPDPVDPGPHPALLDPSQANETAPAQYRIKFETTRGDVILQIHREWAPRGADRFYNLVQIGYFTDIGIIRVVQRPRPFMVQFGIHGTPRISAVWDGARIQDDPVRQANQRGRITFATAGPNTRTTQLFINYTDNSFLDSQGFSPFGEVVEGMEIVDSFYSEYGDGPPRGMGPDQSLLTRQGNSYLKRQYDRLDYIKKATVIE